MLLRWGSWGWPVQRAAVRLVRPCPCFSWVRASRMQQWLFCGCSRAAGKRGSAWHRLMPCMCA